MFTRVHYWALPTYLQPYTVYHLNIIFPFTCNSHKFSSLQPFLTKILYEFFLSHACCMSHPSLFSHQNSTKHEAPHYVIFNKLHIYIKEEVKVYFWHFKLLLCVLRMMLMNDCLSACINLRTAR